MADLIKSQLDYIFFVNGLAFIMLGAVGFTIKNRDNGEMPSLPSGLSLARASGWICLP